MYEIAKEKSIEMANATVAQKEMLIVKSVNGLIGEDWVLADLDGRLVKNIMPDKSEIIKFDGEELLQFFPVKLETKTTETGVTMKATQPYKVLSHE